MHPDPPAPGPPERWSHNNHYHRLILSVIPPGCQRALDVGCGQGYLTRQLRALVPEVTGIDRDARSIEIARQHQAGAGIEYLTGDFLDAPLEAGSLDLITAVASLHHMDAEAAVRRMAALLRPGGVLVVIGLAGISVPADLIREVPSQVGLRLRRAADAWRALRAGGAAPRADAGYTSPIVWPPPLSYRLMGALARRVLPGVHFRRRLYWRYSLVWTKPE